MVVDENIKGVCQVAGCDHNAGCIIFNRRVCIHCFKRFKLKNLKKGLVAWKSEEIK